MKSNKVKINPYKIIKSVKLTYDEEFDIFIIKIRIENTDIYYPIPINKINTKNERNMQDR
ncbi:hypothetical protein KBH77_01300 [Patescibacteria group bacterium]|nr:hypothetical protein [Patescibacteria group bacterium]